MGKLRKTKYAGCLDGHHKRTLSTTVDMSDATKVGKLLEHPEQGLTMLSSMTLRLHIPAEEEKQMSHVRPRKENEACADRDA